LNFFEIQDHTFEFTVSRVLDEYYIILF